MTIPIYWFLVASFFIVALYMNLGPWIYRRPWALLVVGLIASAFSVLLKASPILLKSLPQLSEHFVSLEIAAAAVDPTLIGLSGGLIATAFILKLQITHAQDLAAAKEKVEAAHTSLNDVHRDDEDLKLVARSLSNEEFDTRLKRLKENKVDAVVKKIMAERELQEKQVSGL